MRKPVLIYFIIIMSVFSCTNTDNKKVEVIKIEGLQHLLKEDHHKIHIINFWATWCKPCIKELPQFIEASKQHPEISFSLVTLDFVEDLDTKVYPFLDKRGIGLRVLLMDEVDYNLWIDMVDPSWSGAIPATLIIEPSTEHRIFLEKEFENDELEKEIQKFINHKTAKK
ncbi:MAG: TlpA disulfide reductase family protein [Bacteroidota bacterium]